MKSTVLVLSEATRELLKKLAFPVIPTEANYIAFTEDGNATFFTTFVPPKFTMPRIGMISYYDVENLRIE